MEDWNAKGFQYHFMIFKSFNKTKEKALVQNEALAIKIKVLKLG